MARPPTGKYNVKNMTAAVEKYVAETDYPILKELCLNQGWSYDTIMKKQRVSDELRQSIKKIHDKREVALERGSLSGEYPPAFAIFRLKQPVHGWTDKPPETAPAEPIEIILRRGDET